MVGGRGQERAWLVRGVSLMEEEDDDEWGVMCLVVVVGGDADRHRSSTDTDVSHQAIHAPNTGRSNI